MRSSRSSGMERTSVVPVILELLTPRASGVLIVLIGPAVRLSEYVSRFRQALPGYHPTGCHNRHFRCRRAFYQQGRRPANNRGTIRDRPENIRWAKSSKRPHRILPSRFTDGRLMRWLVKVRKSSLNRARSRCTASNCSNGLLQKWSSMSTAPPAPMYARWLTTG